jgi:hypothetical protein
MKMGEKEAPHHPFSNSLDFCVWHPPRAWLVLFACPPQARIKKKEHI